MAKKPKTLIERFAHVIDLGLVWLFRTSQEEKESDLRQEDGSRSFADSAAISSPSIRQISNTNQRLEFPAAFLPDTVDVYGGGERVLPVIESALAKYSTSLEQVGRITLAYPHKNAEMHPGHYNPATEIVLKFADELKKAAPHVDWVIAHEICEEKSLGRSYNSGSLYALTERQVYNLDFSLGQKPSPFFDIANKEKEYFILVDHVMFQGTTLANLSSFIQHNGGVVLGAASSGVSPFLQKRVVSESPDDLIDVNSAFQDASRHGQRIPQLARVFSESAKKEGYSKMTPGKCIEAFEDALNGVHHSVFSLTQGECNRLIKTVTDETSFSNLLQQLYIAERHKDLASKMALFSG